MGLKLNPYWCDVPRKIRGLLPQTEQALRAKPFIRSTCETVKQTIPISHVLEWEILEKMLRDWPGLLWATRGLWLLCKLQEDCQTDTFQQKSQEHICWPHCIFLSCWIMSLRSFPLGNSPVKSNHRALGEATFLRALFWSEMLRFPVRLSTARERALLQLLLISLMFSLGVRLRGQCSLYDLPWRKEAQVSRTFLTWHNLSNRPLR